jgi:nitrile hydratase beta subunit
MPFTVSYYKRWALGFERLLVKHGLVSAEELAAGRSMTPGYTPWRKLEPQRVPATLRRSSFTREPQGPARFAVGDRVRTKNIHPASATRLPRYARGHVGTVERVQGCHVYPDSVVLGKGDDPQWLYTVVFDGRTLWGEESDPCLKVSIEAFEPYLDAVAS